MEEWIRFMPSEEYIGLRARFRKVVEDNVEEAEGTIVDYPGADAWQYNVAIRRESDGELLPFPNGKPPYFYRAGEKHYICGPFDLSYYYQLINEFDKHADAYTRSVTRDKGGVFTRSDIMEAWKAGYAAGATTVNYLQCRDCPKKAYNGLLPNIRFSCDEGPELFPLLSRADAEAVFIEVFKDTDKNLEAVKRAAPRLLAGIIKEKDK